MEDTGNYSYGLACFLVSNKADLCLESAYRFADELTLYNPPAAAVAQLKTLLSFRLRLIKQKTSIITAIEAHKQLEGYIDISFMMRSLNQQLKALKEQIKKCNEQMDQLVQQDQQLQHQNQLLCSIPGVGKVIAAQVIAYTYGFTKFKDWRKFACYVGTADRSGGPLSSPVWQQYQKKNESLFYCQSEAESFAKHGSCQHLTHRE